MSNNVNINGATDRTSIKCHKIYKYNRGSLNKRLLLESYFMRNILDLSAIMALSNLKPNISWRSVTVWISLVLNNFIKNRLYTAAQKKSRIYVNVGAIKELRE